MKNKICLFLTLFSVITLKAGNHYIISGHIVNDLNSDLATASVCCFVEDTVSVGCTTSNTKGEFKLEVPFTKQTQRIIINHIGYKKVLMNISPSDEIQIRLGDIIMYTDSVRIHEVAVLADNQIRTEEKLMVYPSKEDLRHAYDGYSALDALMVPGLIVNGFDKTIYYMNQDVLICINGREATQDEVRDIHAKYIKRVDLYPMGKPEFPQANTIIDYIMKERDYAGTTSFNANQQLTKLDGNGHVTTQYFQGKSEFALSASAGYKDYRWKDEGHTSTIYNFPSASIIRRQENIHTEDNTYRLNGYMNYLYRDNRQDFYASLRINHSNTERDEWNTLQYGYSPTMLTMQEYQQLDKLSPAVKLQYARKFPKNQRFRTEFYGSYGNNDFYRWYEHREENSIVNTYKNGTVEESYYAIGKVNYTKIFKNRSSINIDLSQDFTHTENLNLRGENVYEISLDKRNTRLNTTYNFRFKNMLNIQTRIAGHISHIESGIHSVNNYFLVPSIRLSAVYKNHSIDIKGQANSNEVSISNRTGDEYRNNEYEITQGNPNLKDYLSYDADLLHSWRLNKNLTWMFYAQYILNTDYIYKTCIYNDSQNALVWSVHNSGMNWRQHYEGCFQWDIIPKRLYMRAGLLYNYSKVNVGETIYHHGLYAMGGVVYQHKGFRVLLNTLTSPETIDFQTGRISQAPISLKMNASYSIDNWNFGISYHNPYRAIGYSTMDLGLYQQYVSSRICRINDNYGSVNISYRFNYGKKKHKFDNSEIVDINQSSISQ